MDAMRAMPDKEYDLAICDPEYGINVTKMNMGGRKTVPPSNKKWDKKPPAPEYFEELFRVSKNQIIWGGNYFSLPPHKCFVIWDKAESMYNRDFAECEQAWASFDRPAKMFKLTPNQLDRIHPTQKPVALYKWLLKNYAKPGDRILDTHGGSMSIAIACHDMGFDLDLWELDEDYYKAGKERFEKHCRQAQLFNPKEVVNFKQGTIL